MTNSKTMLFIVTLVGLIGCVVTYIVTNPHAVPDFLQTITLVLVGASTGVTVPTGEPTATGSTPVVTSSAPTTPSA